MLVSMLVLLLFLATAAGAATVTAIWEDPDNDPATLTAHRLERWREGQTDWATVAEVPPTALTATDTVTEPGEVCWRVLAVAGTLTSSPSNLVCLFFPHAPINVTVTITLGGMVR